MAHGGGGSIASRSAVGLVVLLAGIARGADAPAASPGDAARGLALFTGATRLQNGGAPCGACHAVGGQGPWLAASLGPDLSHSFDGMPAEAVDGLLTDLPFPTMAPVYAGRALTPQERADLGSFLSAATSAPAPAPGGNAVAGGASAIGVLLLALMGARARRRKVPTRGTLVPHPPAPARPSTLGRPISAAPPSGAARTAQGGRR